MSATIRSLKQFSKAVAGFCIRSVPLVRRVYKNGLTIFLYHDVTDTPSRFAEEFGLAVPKGLFARQVSWIAKNFRVIHPLALLEAAPLPENAALITFDDGFHGTFANGLDHLEKMRLPSVVFLNMHAIIEQQPILSAIACYRERHLPHFDEFARSAGIFRPFHLTCTPEIMNRMNEQFGQIDLAAVSKYQGPFADLELVRRYANSELAVYGNHLYVHWNSTALTPAEFTEQYNRNKMALAQFKNSTEFFAFPNGQPHTCFTKSHIELLRRLGARRIFSAAGGINRNPKDYLLGRMTVNARDNNDEILWCRLLRAAVSGQKVMQ
jgi:peptidoglycan/xylan/chitin deacetylase (PgdA/CDA1 family)